MRCFKSFFKHTWQPQQMECPQGRLHQGSGSFGAANIVHEIVGSRMCSDRMTNETELGVLKSSVIPVSAANATTLGTIPCRNGACSKPRPGHSLDSPWHRLKSIFLVLMIVAFLVWLIVFVLLLRYDML